MPTRVNFLSLYVMLAFVLFPVSPNAQPLIENNKISGVPSHFGSAKATVAGNVLVAQKKEDSIPGNKGEESPSTKQNLISEFAQRLKSEPETSFIAQESDENVLIFFNEKGFAPNGIRGLDGKYIFKNETGVACYLKPIEFTQKFKDYLDLHVFEVGIKALKNNYPCPADLSAPGQLKGIDVVLAQKSDLASMNPKRVDEILNLITSKALVSITVFDVNRLKKSLEKQILNSKRLIKEISSNQALGFGILITENSRHGICSESNKNQKDQSKKDSDIKVTKIILEKFKAIDPVGLKKMNLSNVRYMDNPDIFLDVKKNGFCKYVVASSQALSSLIDGFKRDDVKFNIHHHWIKSTKVELEKSLSKNVKVNQKNSEPNAKELKQALENMKAKLVEKQEEIELIKKRRESAKW